MGRIEAVLKGRIGRSPRAPILPVADRGCVDVDIPHVAACGQTDRAEHHHADKQSSRDWSPPSPVIAPPSTDCWTLRHDTPAPLLNGPPILPRNGARSRLHPLIPRLFRGCAAASGRPGGIYRTHLRRRISSPACPHKPSRHGCPSSHRVLTADSRSVHRQTHGVGKRIARNACDGGKSHAGRAETRPMFPRWTDIHLKLRAARRHDVRVLKNPGRTRRSSRHRLPGCGRSCTSRHPRPETGRPPRSPGFRPGAAAE